MGGTGVFGEGRREFGRCRSGFLGPVGGEFHSTLPEHDK